MEVFTLITEAKIIPSLFDFNYKSEGRKFEREIIFAMPLILILL